jgi:hypothetical protein
MMNEFSLQLKPALVRLHTFASSVHEKHFEPTFGRVLRRLYSDRAVMLVEALANSLCPGSGVETALLNKAIQESLLEAVGVKTDLTARQFEKRFGEFLVEHGSKGLIQLFLTSYLNAVTWFALSGTLSQNSVAFHRSKQLIREIDDACNRKVQSLTARWRMWPRVDLRDAEAVSISLQNFLFGDEGSIIKWQETIRSGFFDLSL